MLAGGALAARSVPAGSLHLQGGKVVAAVGARLETSVSTAITPHQYIDVNGIYL
jgi:hypothetical protein